MNVSARRLTQVPPPAPQPKGKRLSPAQEKALARRVQFGDPRAKQQMVECNLGLVVALAAPYRGRGVPFADLVQEGTVGLIRAVEGFDPDRGLRLSTYAAWWIRRSLLDALAATRTIRIPHQAAQQMAAVRRAEEELSSAGQGPVSGEDIARFTGLGAATVTTLQSAARVTASLDEPTGEGARPLRDAIEDPNGVQPDWLVAEAETRQETWALLRTLPDRHRKVVLWRYGIGGTEPKSPKQIGQLLGVKEERVRQLEREALNRLRELAAPGRRAA